MTRFALAAGLAALALTTPIRADENDDALKQLEGVYVVTGLKAGTKSLGPDDLKKFGGEEAWTFTFKGNQVTFRAGARAEAAALKVDVSKNPPQIDIVVTKKPKEDDASMYGVYELKDDTLTINATRTVDKRPTDLKPTRESVVLTLTRKKP